MPLSKKRMRERKRQDRVVKPSTPMSNLVKPKTDASQSTGSPLEGESNTGLPLYNPRIHKQGDRVRMPNGIEVIVPELDEEKNPVPEM